MKPITLTEDAKILIIRRDNIGDLLLTTPLIHSIREKYPKTRIDLFVNSYNAPIIKYNNDVNSVYTYTKGKHNKTRTLFRIYIDKAKTILRLRKNLYDLIILTRTKNPTRDHQLASFIRPNKILLFSNGFHSKTSKHLDHTVQNPWSGTLHLVEELHHLANAIGINRAPGPLILNVKDRHSRKQPTRLWPPQTVGIHISSRKPSQRWPIDHFSELMDQLHSKREVKQFLIFWSPGPEDHPQHPGDDANLGRLLGLTDHLPVQPYQTLAIEDLVTGLSIVDIVICSDGGAMHIAAALEKPILCFFGNSDPVVWHPWKVPYQLLQPGSLNVRDISVDNAVSAWDRLNEQLSAI